MNDSASPATGPAPGAGRNFDRLKDLLWEMFQLDRGDLDFGLYRIMNMKAAEIEAFLERDLLPQVATALKAISNDDRQRIENELRDTIGQLEALQAPVEDNATVKGLRAQLAEATADADAEADVYGHLFNFFDRYYREGDFMSLRRYSGGGEPTYLIPYDGEEVKLHWANADQYYVKTTENYASYAFTAGEGDAAFRVRFEIAAADNEKDNIKETNGRQRRFVLAEDAVALDGKELVVRFEHRPLTDREKRDWSGNSATQQGRINADLAARVQAAAERLDPGLGLALAASAPTKVDPDRTLLTKHVERYTAKNSFDYFIHKDLGGFLTRELDLYLKTDLLDLQDLALGDAGRLRRALGRMRAVREIGGKLIAFLAQLEDFQKRLWLKKKFVLETHWCVTLDRVPEALYPEIVANKAQWEEWRGLFAAGNTGRKRAEFLKTNPYLALDTRHFDRDFKDRLLVALSEIDSLEAQTNGFLVRGENFQALHLLETRYRQQIQCVYIDPPYNAPNSEIAYKNDYKHSSFLSLIEGRLNLSRNFSSDDGSHIVAIDKYEGNGVFRIIDDIFPYHDNVSVSIEHNRRGVQGDHFSFTHEYALFAIPPGRRTLNSMGRPEQEWEFSSFRNWGGESLRTDAANCFYAILVRDNHIIGFGDVWTNENDHPDGQNVRRDDGVIEIYPIDGHGVERKWRYERGTVEDIRHKLKVVESRNGILEVKIAKTDDQFKTVWYAPRYNAGDNGTRVAREMGLPVGQFDYPKSIFTTRDCVFAVSDSDAHILDYFAGSGTTGHAVINLNREDGGSRKYILVEMGDHFDTVMLPRLKKVVYAPKWKGGKPVSRDKGVSQLIRYVRLESYEDTLDGLVVTPPAGDLLAENDPAMVEDYRLRYALDAETAGSPCLLGRHFRDPFAYTLSVVRDGVRRETPVDLPETFNLLLGLRVESRRRLDGVLAIVGKDPQGQNCLILWRNLDETDNEALNRWFVANRANLPEAPDLIYANGDHTLNGVRGENDAWKAKTIEPKFRQLMFERD